MPEYPWNTSNRINLELGRFNSRTISALHDPIYDDIIFSSIDRARAFYRKEAGEEYLQISFGILQLPIQKMNAKLISRLLNNNTNDPFQVEWTAEIHTPGKSLQFLQEYTDPNIEFDSKHIFHQPKVDRSFSAEIFHFVFSVLERCADYSIIPRNEVLEKRVIDSLGNIFLTTEHMDLPRDETRSYH
jgi:hypothetical protein